MLGTDFEFVGNPTRCNVEDDITYVSQSFDDAFVDMTYHQIIIAGDSNVARFLPVVKAAKKDGELQATELLRVTNVVQLKEQLSVPKQASDHLIVAALTNIITSHVYQDSNALISFCERTFAEVMTWVEAGRTYLPGANANVSLKVFLATIATTK
jgi:hypothetical protein